MAAPARPPQPRRGSPPEPSRAEPRRTGRRLLPTPPGSAAERRDHPPTRVRSAEQSSGAAPRLAPGAGRRMAAGAPGSEGAERGFTAGREEEDLLQLDASLRKKGVLRALLRGGCAPRVAQARAGAAPHHGGGESSLGGSRGCKNTGAVALPPGALRGPGRPVGIPSASQGDHPGLLQGQKSWDGRAGPGKA